MKFEELKKKLKNESIKQAYLVVGSDLFLKQKAQELILDAVVLQNKELNSVVFSSDNLDADRVIDACNTMPFFADKKLVLIKEYEKKSSDALLKKLTTYLSAPNETSCLVIVTHEGSDYFESLKKHMEVVDCSPLSGSMLDLLIEAEVKKHNKTIDFIAKQLLIDYTAGDMSRIQTEILKLVHYCGDNININADAIKEHVTKDLEFEIYELTEALGNKKSAEAFVILNTLLANKNTVSATLASIYRHFRRLFYIAVNTELSFAQLAQKLEVKEFAIKKSSEQAKKFGAMRLKAINELCTQIDYKSKIGKMDAEKGLDFLVLNILNM